MDSLLADMEKRIANMVRRGVIHSVVMGRTVMVRVSLGDLTTTLLPWCQAQASANMQVSNPPAVGDAVTVLSESGDLDNGRVYAGANIDAVPAPEGSENEHVTRYGDGTEVRYDREAHALTVTLIEGGTYTVKGDGTLDGNVTITKTLTVNEDATIQGAASVTGNIASAAEIQDKTGTVSLLREVFNAHDHNETGSLTGKPNTSMQ